MLNFEELLLWLQRGDQRRDWNALLCLMLHLVAAHEHTASTSQRKRDIMVIFEGVQLADDEPILMVHELPSARMPVARISSCSGRARPQMSDWRMRT
jgi:hypothetical protein